MRPGVDRSDTAYTWPASLLAPPGTRLVYLDLNHWIYLAQAATGHRAGARYRHALDALRQATDDVVITLAAVHYMEMAGITDPRQRSDIAAVMEELTDFACVMPESTVIKLELDAAVAQIAGVRERFTPISLVGRGVLQAFGRQGGLRIGSPEGDATPTVRAGWPSGPEQFDAWREDAERQLDRVVLQGPTDAEAPTLKASGWDPTVARRIAEERVRQEREQAARLAQEPQWRRGRLRDVVAARYLALEVQAMLDEALSARSLSFTDVMPDAEAARRFTDSMPSADVRISLLTAAHRNPQTRWEPNDIFDIDALSVAVPYCDIVVTERHAHHVIHTAGLPALLGTRVLANLDELVAELGDGAHKCARRVAVGPVSGT
jgi:hypothetical protein